VDHNNSLVVGLTRLNANLANPEILLENELRNLSNDLARAVNSYLGLEITITDIAGPVSLTAWRDDRNHDVIGSSLLISLPSICAATPGSTLILYAAKPGAFVDLTADLSFALGEPLTAFVLDQHLDHHLHAGAHSELTGLAEFSQINRAIGVLVACGHTPKQAHAELWHRATDAHQDLHTTAKVILSSAELGLGPHVFWRAQTQ